jgi:hypothetical protein
MLLPVLMSVTSSSLNEVYDTPPGQVDCTLLADRPPRTGCLKFNR